MGFRKISFESSPKEFNWNPDIYAEKKNESIAIEIRESEEIPEFFLQRMALTGGLMDKLLIYILFPFEPKKSIVKKIEEYNIGILILRKNRFEVLKKSKNFSKKRIKKIFKSPKVFVIFLSSKQSIPERKIAKNLIKTFEYFCDPNKVKLICHEWEGYENPKKIWERIKDDINKSEFFVSVLSYEYSPIVQREIIYAFHQKKKISILVKLISVSRRDKKLNEFIKKIEVENWIKYANYDSLEDFKQRFLSELFRIVKPNKTN